MPNRRARRIWTIALLCGAAGDLAACGGDSAAPGDGGGGTAGDASTSPGARGGAGGVTGSGGAGGAPTAGAPTTGGGPPGGGADAGGDAASASDAAPDAQRSDGGNGASDAPLGMVSFFNDAACPAGWMRSTDTAGRLLVGTVTGAEVGVVTGAALADREDRTHAHEWSAVVSVVPQAIAAADGANTNPGAAGPVNLQGTTSSDASGLPFQQLLACELAQDDGDGFPEEVVAYFDRTSCPSGWVSEPQANGRILLPAPNSSGVLAGSASAHTHTVSVELVVNETSVAGVLGGGNLGAADSGPHAGTGNADPGDPLGGLPTVRLLVCRKTDPPSPSASVPLHTLAFFDADTCPSSWQRATPLEGYFPIPAPQGSPVNIAFGGPALASGEERTHSHTLSGTIVLPSHGIALATGCCGGGVGASGVTPFTGFSSEGALSPPRLELRLCERL